MHIKTLRNICTSEIRKARSIYHQTLLIENDKNPKEFWQIIKSIFPSKKSKSKPCITSEGNKSIAKLFAIFSLS